LSVDFGDHCPGTQVYADQYDIYARLPEWGYGHKTVCHSRGEYARDADGDGFHEVHVNTMRGFWSLLRSWLRPTAGSLRGSCRDIWASFSSYTTSSGAAGAAPPHALGLADRSRLKHRKSHH